MLSKPITANADNQFKIVNANENAEFDRITIGFDWYEHELWMSEGVTRTSIIKNDNLAYSATTNGTDIYYASFYGTVNDLSNEWGMNIYKRDIASGKSEYIGKVKYGMGVVFCYNDDLYVETAADGGMEIPEVNRFSISENKCTLLYSGTKINFIQGDYLICCAEPGEFDNTGHYMYKVCAINYKDNTKKLLAKQGYGALLYKKNKIRFIKVFKNKRIYSGQIYEFNLKTKKSRAISNKFRSAYANVSMKKTKAYYYDNNYKKKVLKLK